MQKTFEDAYTLAQRAHAHQMYGAGPYMAHIDGTIDNVDRLIAALPPDTIASNKRTKIRIVAALHDAPEDHEQTGITHAMIAAEGYDDDVCRWLKRLDTAYKIGSYHNNIEAMAVEGEIAVIIVKLADNLYNRRPESIAGLPPEKQSILGRYERAGNVLQAAYDEFKDAAWAAHREES